MTSGDQSFNDDTLHQAQSIAWAFLSTVGLTVAGVGGFLLMYDSWVAQVEPKIVYVLRGGLVFFGATDFFMAKLITANMVNQTAELNQNERSEKLKARSLLGLAFGITLVSLCAVIAFLTASLLDLILGIAIFLPFLFMYYPRRDDWDRIIQEGSYN